MDLSAYLAPHGITLCGAIALRDCTVHRAHLLTREGFDPNRLDDLWVCVFAIPYLTPRAFPSQNVSDYAVCEDYHLFVKQLGKDVLPRLQHDFPSHRFCLFADHSPIDEIEAAERAGLGVRGKNHLLLTEKYSSYVFLGEIVTDLALSPTGQSEPPRRLCDGCNACFAVCPMQREGGPCRSALTQKKSPLTDEESRMLSSLETVWGCDMCQQVCPYTIRAKQAGTIYTSIPFFRQHLLPYLTIAQLDEMDEQAFARRAYAWRERQTIRRNLLLHEQSNDTQGKEES